MFRRPLAGHGHGRLSVGGGAPVDLRLLRFADGTFTRGGEASYQTGANTLAWAASNELRWEDRGDGNGAVALFEGGSENIVSNPEDPAAWSLSNASVGSTGLTAPDGDTDAKAIDFNTAGNARGEDTLRVDPTDSVTHTMSAFARLIAGSSTQYELRTQNEAGAISNPAQGLSAAWARAANSYDMGAGATAPLAGIEAADSLGSEVAAWGLQVEELPFASSYIRNGAARPADVLTFTPAQIPAAMLSGRWEFDFYPLFDSLVTPPSEGRMFHFISVTGPFDGITFANRRFGIRVGNVTPTPPVVSFSAGQKITLSMDMAAGTMTVAGCTTGNGTRDYSAFIGTSGFPTPTDLYVGSRNGIAPTWGRISEPRVW